MTRREQIENNIGYQMTHAAIEYIQAHEYADRIDSFEAGAEWMQEIMIDKATKWLFKNVYDYFNPEDQERVESFRKYLEE